MKRFWIELHLCIGIVFLIVGIFWLVSEIIFGKHTPAKVYLFAFAETYLIVLITVPISKLIIRIGDKFDESP